jgi:hypothetical protein
MRGDRSSRRLHAPLVTRAYQPGICVQHDVVEPVASGALVDYADQPR